MSVMTSIAAEIHEALSRGLQSGHPSVDRLRHARTSIRFTIEDEAVTLLLDRTPPEVTEGDEPAEIEITLTPEQAARYAAGKLPIPRAVVTGTVRSRGPVRKYLEVDAIVQWLIGETGSDGADSDEAPIADAAGRPGPVDPSLLAIETRGLHKRFGSNQVLAGIDLQVPAGVISVVLGPSGTGKSVLLQHVIGLLAPDSGDVLVHGRPLSKMSRSEILDLRCEIGVMFQDGALFSAMSVYDNVAFPLRQHTDLEESVIREIVEEHLGSVGLSAAASRLPSELSGGMKKRAGLARALVLEPSILLVDEPDSGLDPVRTALLGDLLVEQHAAHGGTMLVVTHNVELATRISDHISVLWRGGVLEAGMAEEVLASETEFVQQFLAGGTVGPLGMDA
jgi:phospholipid/cholesterol/gamma-HCH transport system ATP-binding protein